MKKNRITLITNLILIFIVTAVFSVSMFTQSIIPVALYSSDGYKPIYNGNKQNNNVSFMFNVYENTKVVNDIVTLLEQNNVNATFFVGGCWADDNQNTLKRIVECGNEIANHGYFHRDHSSLSFERNREEIYNTEQMVLSLCGVKTTLFAPPSGSFNETTLDAAKSLNYTTVMWTKDTIDWRDNSAEKIVSRATKNLSGGDLILMHPKEHTLACLQTIIDECVNNGYNIVTVTENIK